jgi:hypothetical protein
LAGIPQNGRSAVDDERSANAATCFLELAKNPTYPLDRLSRYEATLWRQAGQIIFTLDALRRRTQGMGADITSSAYQFVDRERA